MHASCMGVYWYDMSFHSNHHVKKIKKRLGRDRKCCLNILICWKMIMNCRFVNVELYLWLGYLLVKFTLECFTKRDVSIHTGCNDIVRIFINHFHSKFLKLWNHCCRQFFPCKKHQLPILDSQFFQTKFLNKCFHITISD